MSAAKRIGRDLNILTQEPVEGCSAAPYEGNLYKWRATIMGPKDTPYEGGIFHLEIELAQDYPFTAPKVKFKTPVYHPNIDDQGSICLDILKSQWSPALNIKSLLLSISSLLVDPNPKDPLMPEIAKQFTQNREKYNQTVKDWVIKHAS